MTAIRSAHHGIIGTLFGCVNNAQTLYQGTPEDVYRQARTAIEAGVDVICPECAIPLARPLENLKAIVEAKTKRVPSLSEP